MRRFALALIALAPLAAGAASPSPSLYQCGYSVVSTGDPVAKMISACGQPARTERIETRQGGAVGTRYEYDRNNATVVFIVASGRIVRIETIR